VLIQLSLRPVQRFNNNRRWPNFAIAAVIFIIGLKPPIEAQPAQYALDNPMGRQDLEAAADLFDGSDLNTTPILPPCSHTPKIGKLYAMDLLNSV
jgi:hypothetical protein